LKIYKTNTVDYLNNLQNKLEFEGRNFLKVDIDKNSRLRDYILNFNILPEFTTLLEAFKNHNYTCYTLYNLNPFKVHPMVMDKIKKIDNQYVLYYIILDCSISKKRWKDIEREITEVMYDASGSSFTNYWRGGSNRARNSKCNMYFEMLDYQIGAFKVNPAKRIIKPKPFILHLEDTHINIPWDSGDGGTSG